MLDNLSALNDFLAVIPLPRCGSGVWGEGLTTVKTGREPDAGERRGCSLLLAWQLSTHCAVMLRDGKEEANEHADSAKGHQLLRPLRGVQSQPQNQAQESSKG